jgi:hypothetical protein
MLADGTRVTVGEDIRRRGPSVSYRAELGVIKPGAQVWRKSCSVLRVAVEKRADPARNAPRGVA